MKPLVRILARFLLRVPRICTILQDLAKNFKKNAKLFSTEKKRTKSNFCTKTSQEIPRSTKIRKLNVTLHLMFITFTIFQTIYPRGGGPDVAPVWNPVAGARHQQEPQEAAAGRSQSRHPASQSGKT